jgi:nitrate/TMAO reductase-like tetraheme cytochrome c subunit
MTLLILLLVVALLLLAPLVLRPSLTLRHGGRLFAFVAIVVVPVAAGFAGLHEHVERTKTVAFCTSCHAMEPYGRSLHVDDVEHLAAQHWQYNRVPQETACFACHTSYTLYGDYQAKLRGLRHVWVQYAGTVPSQIRLYSPYHNRECLHCHDGARSFLESVTHRPELAAIRKNRKSCLTKGCHDQVHDVAHVGSLASWPKEEAK